MAAKRKAKSIVKSVTRKARQAPPPAPPPAPQRDYLVIFEEPDPYGLPADDSLVLAFDQPTQTRPEVDVQQKVAIELSNITSRAGTVGFAITSLGALMGIGLMVAFNMVYPWYGAASTHRLMILLSVLTLLLLVGGTILTHYGRRIKARGRLSDMRIVEKNPQASARFE